MFISGWEFWGTVSYSQQLVAERYRLTSLIGSGGMGRVWLARDEVLRRDVAVKEVILPEGMSFEERDELFQRTLREARAAGRLSHPNVAAIYDVVQAQGRPWIVMELIRSRSLYDTIKEDGPVSPRRAAEIGLAVLAALRAAHNAGVWHRDVKPGNVLLAEDGRVVLTDFGLATFEGDGTVTRAGVILGSAQYIAPERARAGAFGPESDMWSLGATLYAAVEGRSPYARDTPMATLTALATAPPDPPRRAGPLRQVLIGLLRKNPRLRMRPAEVEKLLLRIVNGDTLRRRAGLLARRPADRIDPSGPTSTPPRPGGALTEPSPPGGTPVQRPSLGLEAMRDGEFAAIGAARPETALTAAPARGPAGDAGGAPGVRDPRPATRAEATARPAPVRPRTWPWLLGAVGIAMAVAVPTAAYLRNEKDRQAGLGAISATGTATAPPSPTRPALTDAMRVQACRDQAGDRETTVVPQGGAALENWTTLVDPAGFRMNVPVGWGMSHVGAMACYRDPFSLKTLGVYANGPLADDLVNLVADTTDWVAAADLTGFTPLGVQDLHLPEGGAMLQYTYQRGPTKMHGQVTMMRRGGNVFTVYLLTSDNSWNVDREYLLAGPASFDLAS